MILDLEGEIWKEIKGFEGKYYVSNKGRVKRKGVNRYFLLKGHIRPNGYVSYILSKGRRNSKFEITVHRLVLCTFTDKPFNYEMYVNHKDENKQNNCLENLEWCTPKYNSNYGTQIERGIETKLDKINLSIYETKKITRENFNNLCKRRNINPLDYTEVWDGVSLTNTTRKKKLFNYFFVGEGKGKRIIRDQFGQNNPSSKPIEYWETNPTTMNNFKTVCKRQGWNYEDFEVILVGKKGKGHSTVNLYVHKLKSKC